MIVLWEILSSMVEDKWLIEWSLLISRLLKKLELHWDHQINKQRRKFINQTVDCLQRWADYCYRNLMKLKFNIFIVRSSDSPVCVLMWRFRRLGRSKAFPQTSHGRRFRSLRAGLDFGVDFGMIAESIKSPVLLAPDDCNDSPDIDLCSSSDGGEMGRRTRDNSDNDRSSGESRNKVMQRCKVTSKVSSHPNKSNRAFPSLSSLSLPVLDRNKFQIKISSSNSCKECKTAKAG